MQQPTKGSIKKALGIAGLAGLAGLGGLAIYNGIHMIPSADNPDRLDADFTVVQDWKGRETSGFINDNWTSEIKVFSGDALTKTNVAGFGFNDDDYTATTVASGAPIGTMSLEDHGRGEVMIARNQDGKIIAGWNEEVNRDSFGPFFTGTFDMKGMLIGHIDNKPAVVSPENIPGIGDYSIRVGLTDADGNVQSGAEYVPDRPFDGWLFGEQRDGTTIQTLKMVNGEAVVDDVLTTSKHDWAFRGAPGIPEVSTVKDSNENIVYTITGKYWDENPRSPFDGYTFANAEGEVFAEVDVLDPSFAKQLGYEFSVDKNGDGNLETVGTFYFNAIERCMSGTSDDCYTYHWVGEMWAKLPGETQAEKAENMKYADMTMKLMSDIIPVNNDGAMFNIEEYTDFAMLFLDTQDNGLAKADRLADAITSADTLDYQEALDKLVYRTGE